MIISAGHDEVILSEQMLVDCGEGSCEEGGEEWNGLQTIIDLGGSPLEEDYPYTAEDGKVHFL